MTGSWNTIDAVVSRWESKGLDAEFEVLWEDQSKVGAYPPMCENEIEEGTPRPYCVFEQLPTGDTEQMSCRDADRVHVQTEISIHFRIHAEDKSQAVSLAKLVVAAFDNANFSAGSSHVVGCRRVGDFGSKDGDEGYVWVVRYNLIEDSSQVISE